MSLPVAWLLFELHGVAHDVSSAESMAAKVRAAASVTHDDDNDAYSDSDDHVSLGSLSDEEEEDGGGGAGGQMGGGAVAPTVHVYGVCVWGGGGEAVESRGRLRELGRVGCVRRDPCACRGSTLSLSLSLI